MSEKYCEKWDNASWGSPKDGMMSMDVQCGYPAIGTLNGVPVCEKHKNQES